MERRRQTRAEAQSETRARLLNAAADVFAEHGYQAASIQEIAERAGYTHGAVYANFKGKEDLFLATFERYMGLRAVELADAIGQTGAPTQQARAAADQWMHRFAADRKTFLLHLEFMIHAARNPELSRKFGARMAALRTEIERRLTEFAERTGRPLPMPAQELALVLRALGIGLAVEALNDPQPPNLDLYGDFMELLIASVAAGGR